MSIEVYEPADFSALEVAAKQMGANSSLRHRPFVDYYYATREGCKLYLVRSDEEANRGEVTGSIGVDTVRFEYEGEPMMLGFASNYNALQKGVGGVLYLRWVRSCPLGAVLGANELTHAILRKQKWTYYSGIKAYFLNRDLSLKAGESANKRLAKTVLKIVTRPVNIAQRAAKLPGGVTKRVSVREETEYTADLLPRQSPFRFRCAPDIEYLQWRYNLQLTFARYRLFRLLVDGRTTGYVILHETEKRITVAQTDGENAEDLAYGILLSLGQASSSDRTPREVLLVSCHPAMQKVLHGFGFRTTGQERQFALGGSRKPVSVDADTSDWLVNYDWTDNCLRAPFPDQ